MFNPAQAFMFRRCNDARAASQISTAALGLVLLLRGLNRYGEPHPRVVGATALETIMSFLNLTKYPPSADFVLLTRGAGALLLA